MRFEGFYKDDKAVDKWTFYNEDGTISNVREH